jgi:hypothetical protein
MSDWLFNLMRRLGKWLHEWPCNNGHHEYGLLELGTVLWSCRCAHCGTVNFKEPRGRAEVDPAAWNKYADRHGLERMEIH